MQARRYIVPGLVGVVSLWIVSAAGAQSTSQTVQPSPPLFFQTEWKETKTQRLVVSADLTNPNLEQRQYGPDMKIQDVKVEHGIVLDTKNDPVHVWTGLCLSRCLLTFREKNSYVDLSVPAARISPAVTAAIWAAIILVFMVVSPRFRPGRRL